MQQAREQKLLSGTSQQSIFENGTRKGLGGEEYTVIVEKKLLCCTSSQNYTRDQQRQEHDARRLLGGTGVARSAGKKENLLEKKVRKLKSGTVQENLVTSEEKISKLSGTGKVTKNRFKWLDRNLSPSPKKFRSKLGQCNSKDQKKVALMVKQFEMKIQ
jgi:hypothetical protein